MRGSLPTTVSTPVRQACPSVRQACQHAQQPAYYLHIPNYDRVNTTSPRVLQVSASSVLMFLLTPAVDSDVPRNLSHIRRVVETGQMAFVVHTQATGTNRCERVEDDPCLPV